jgi:hypothetical protein
MVNRLQPASGPRLERRNRAYGTRSEGQHITYDYGPKAQKFAIYRHNLRYRESGVSPGVTFRPISPRKAVTKGNPPP